MNAEKAILIGTIGGMLVVGLLFGIIIFFAPVDIPRAALLPLGMISGFLGAQLGNLIVSKLIDGR